MAAPLESNMINCVSLITHWCSPKRYLPIYEALFFSSFWLETHHNIHPSPSEKKRLTNEQKFFFVVRLRLAFFFFNAFFKINIKWKWHWFRIEFITNCIKFIKHSVSMSMWGGFFFPFRQHAPPPPFFFYRIYFS